MVEFIGNKTVFIALLVMVGFYVLFLVYSLLKPAKSNYEQEIERIISSDQHKVKGRFE